MLRLSFGMPSCEDDSTGRGGPGPGNPTGDRMKILDRYLLRQFLGTFVICF